MLAVRAVSISRIYTLHRIRADKLRELINSSGAIRISAGPAVRAVAAAGTTVVRKDEWPYFLIKC